MDRRSFIVGTGASVALGAARVAQAAESSSGDIVIGQSAVLSGPLAPSVLVMQGGSRLAFDEVNAQGGIAERKIRLVSLDDTLDSAKAQANYKTLVQQHNALACFLGVGAAPTLGGLAPLRDSGTPLVGATAVSDSVREKSEGVAFYTRASQGREVEALLQQISTVGLTRIGFAWIRSPGGAEVLAQLKKAAQKFKIEVISEVAVAPDASDVEAAGKAMAAQPVQAVIVYHTAAPGAAFVKTVLANGGAPSFYALSIFAGDVAAKLLGEQARGIAVSQVTPYPWDNANTDSIRYRQAAEKAKVPLGYQSYEGYIAARVLVDAMRQCGGELSRARLRTALGKLKTRVATLDIDFGTNRSNTGTQFIELVQARSDGRFVR
ncbi:ABC transporter substrate-binding protein [Variovorax robiniae]|uniref:ABC transporter substrate-binding protein n=1 Tax=Variovorax robiniae TaxID=1836199 RepID=A0ABU8X7T9_9BURK